MDIFGGQTGTQTVQQESKNRPWYPQGQYLLPGFAEAANLYGRPDQQDYIGMTPTSRAGYDMMATNANNPNSALNIGINGLRDTAAGNFLASGNPYLEGAIANAQRPVTEQWRNQVAPGIDASFSGAGRYGSGLYAQSRNSSEETLARQLGEISTNMAYQNYGDERGRMTQAQALLPDLAGRPAQDLVTAGNANQADAQANQGWDYQRLLQYLNAVGGQSWGGSTSSTSTQPTYSNPLGQGLGYIATLGSLF